MKALRAQIILKAIADVCKTSALLSQSPHIHALKTIFRKKKTVPYEFKRINPFVP